MLAGYARGGQVYVPGKRTPRIPARFGQWNAGGICQGPRCPVVVSRGVGMAYLPVRLGRRPKIVLVTLTPWGRGRKGAAARGPAPTGAVKVPGR
jgi:predicted MPP superfamily phosphohydrolase